ncbi:iron complex outermembrane receptor protein [Lysobacter niabensis]|uniref:Iron complex outermembrane receptor protein n=1 Tax=Agrilutibacter niabensis TaxID=380628 RepID=A0ABU1VTL5_9GAMM|nr:TonB-dependent receptor [Lysobacter niabensis]MDR7100710.1 iron complex outermembrane receptor protein [Lysobacter niabensis]
MTHRHTAMQRGLLPVSIALALAPAFAGAQEAPAAPAEQATTLDRIEVTGSRIRQSDLETAQPVIQITREQIQQQGFTSVADILQNLTSAGSPAISRAQALASGEDVGGYYIDIRNLGAERTLVLVNGHRLGISTSGLQDLSQIPVSAIERIEVLKDGGSSLYGSDAIAGVVNVITRSNFDGIEANAYLGQYSQGDGQKQSYDFTIGNQGERSSLTVSFEYTKEDPVMAKDRPFSSYGNVGENYADDYPFSGWSPVSQNGSALLPCGPGGTRVFCTLTPGTDPRNIANYKPIVASQFANSNEQMFVQTGIERHSVFVNGSVDITDNIRFKTDLQYNKRTTDQQIAGYPYQITATNGFPLLSANSYFNPTPGTAVNFRRRLWEVPRTTESNLETFRVAAGFEGSFQIGEKYWDWDVSANLNRNDNVKSGVGDASLLAAAKALGPSWFNPATGRVECGTAAAPIKYGTNAATQCVPWNPMAPFGDTQAGSLSGNPDLVAFLFPQYTDTGRTNSKTYSANLSGSPFTLPAGDLGLAVGIEHRSEDGRFVPDAFRQAGTSTGLPATTTSGAYSLDEIYGELEIPVLADMPFAKELSFNVATRYSDYSNFGDTLNSKFSLRWRPMDGLLVRGTYAEGFRAPSINDLFGGLSASFESYTDPCGVGANNSVNGNAACNAAGVPLGYVQLGQGLVPCTGYPCQTPDQFTSGSNPTLTPETATTKTAGLVWSPKWVEGLDIELDWYNYELTNAIIQDSPDTILRDCYVLGNAERCNGINNITRAADGHVTGMFFGLANLGALETEGWDLNVSYKLPETSFGKFAINWDNSYTSKYDTLTQDEDGNDIMVGQVGTGGVFRLRSNFGVNWTKGIWGANWTARYYSGLYESCVPNRPCNDPDRIANGVDDAINRLGSNTFHDVQVYAKLPWEATVAVGANNVGDHLGPTMFTQPSSNFPYYGGFDIGRTIYVKYQQRF